GQGGRRLGRFPARCHRHPCHTERAGHCPKALLPEAVKAALESAAGNFVLQPGSNCAGDDYPGMVLEDHEFALYWRALPWDHAPGALFISEAGGVVARLDGTPYQPGQQMKGLLAARSQAIWNTVRSLLPDVCSLP